MARYSTTKYAGQRAEKIVESVLRRYTDHIYTNVRVDTLFTQSGSTEIDVIAAVSDVLLVVEVKNVSSIEGSLQDSTWVLRGAEAGESYLTLNVFTQNRIHVRSLKDAWFSRMFEFPVTLSVVVVPNGAYVSEELRCNGILTVSEFNIQVAELCADNQRQRYGYALDYLLSNSPEHLHRPDFGR